MDAGDFIQTEGERATRAEFDAAAACVAAGIRAAGLEEGDTVAFLMRNDLTLAQAMVGADRAGVYSVPLNWHGSQDEIHYVLQDSRAKLLIAHADLYAALASERIEDIPVIIVPPHPLLAQRYGLSVEQAALPRGHLAWQDWLSGQAPSTVASTRPRGAMIYTSGSTGKPKGVQRQPYQDLDSYRANLATLHAAFGTRPGMRAAISGPLYHGGPAAYFRAAYAACAEHGQVVLRSKFDAEETLALIDAHRLTHLFMVPTMFVRLLRLPDSVKQRYDVSSLEHVVHTAAPCAPEIKTAMLDWFGDVIHEFYGTTETGPVTVATPADARLRSGTVGRILDQVRLEILSPEGEALPTGAVGEICCRNATYPDFTYRNRPQERQELERNGLIATGDVGYRDIDGYLYICDRIKDMVISGGVNIYPAEIEAELLKLPAVRDCAVFGIPDSEFGESLAAHVELQEGFALSESDLRAYLSSRLASFKVPKVVRFDTALPRQDNGKIYKRKLAEHYRTRQ